MKAIICSTLDGPNALTYGDFDDPEISAGMVKVEMKAASLNFPDVLITYGKYQMKPELPFIPGGEGAGVITEVGEGVTHLAVGDRVMVTTMAGAFADYAVVPAMMAMKIPETMSFSEAAAFMIIYGTSYHALKQRANIQSGEKLLVMGAAGGVGLATIQIAKAMGAEVIAAASNSEKLAVCEQNGADHCINYSEGDVKALFKQAAPKGFDVVYDPVGGDMSEIAFRNMAYNGRHLVIGFAAGDIPAIPANLALLKMCQLVGVFWGSWAMKFPQDQMRNMKELFELYEAKKVKPLVESSYKMADFKEAYACLTERRVKGKVVLEIGS
ncbi:NADPH:quinone oxidoreductase family protein [Temperatibacter marinus]|uniref:NADPH:quinone oxidoreductase family protein n=1 Tax=Temperatibacter marinus TaxID=1456591 RepID=A0AA52H8G8_9PROT|nr:NADPH:quinone oxidoreductase family protein [Temperatibacter marinus]WND01824.1 NADPH:quinone oxidoreductase family protein [Temperatibacter marinus]